jgi:hypothetical protein
MRGCHAAFDALAELLVVDELVGTGAASGEEHRMVENIERFAAEGQLESLIEMQIFCSRKVPVEIGWPDEYVPREISRFTNLRIAETARHFGIRGLVR